MYISRTHRVDYKTVAAAKAAARVKQIGLLILTTILGILVSVTVNY